MPTLEGATEVVLEPGTQPGERVVVRGRGMPRLRRNGRGDLQVLVNVQIPRHLSAEQRELLARLAETITEENLRGEDSVRAKLRRWLHPHAA